MRKGYECLNDDIELNRVAIKSDESRCLKFSHIADLDKFFTAVYEYFMNRSFATILVKGILKILTWILTFVVLPIAWTCLGDAKREPEKIWDIFGPYEECGKRWPTLVILSVIIGSLVAIFWLLMFIKTLSYYWFIKQFYNEALGVADHDLCNFTWQNIMQKIQAAQLKEKMCITRSELSELHIYQRILRRKNYLIALVNKKYLPPRLNLPIIGTVVYWPSGLQFIINMLFFTGPIAVFENSFKIRNEYKERNARNDLKERFEKLCICVCVISLILCPFLFIWELAHALFTYIEAFKRDPSYFGARIWSPHAQFYLRHFNEMDHELEIRLNAGYRHSMHYLSSFRGPFKNAICSFLCKTCACLSALLSGVAIRYVELPSIVVFYVSIFAAAAIFLYSCISDKSQPSNHEELLSEVVKKIHYLPINWQGQAHTTDVRNEFEQLFEVTGIVIIKNLLSPLLTPIILYTHVYPQAEKFIDFFRAFTVDADNMGDVCQLSLMSIKKSGDPTWQFGTKGVKETVKEDKATETEDGKTELSLINFARRNPNWSPPQDAKDFISNVEEETKNMEKPNSIGTGAMYLHNLHHSHVPDFHRAVQEDTSLL